MDGKLEKKIVFKDGEHTRVLRGHIIKEDAFFITIQRNDGEFRIGKQFIIKIENNNKNNVEADNHV